MDLTRARLRRLVVDHKNRLEQHYGHDQHHLFQARGLAILSIVFSLFLSVVVIAFLLIDSSLMSVQTKLIFLPLKLLMIAAFVTSYVFLTQGRDALARRLVAVTVVGGVTAAVALTGGLPTSVAAPNLLLPAILFFCLYGARAGMFMAFLMPALALAMFLVPRVLNVTVPDFTSPESPALNLSIVLLATHVVAVLAIASYERNNRSLSERLDAELAKHAQLANQDPLTGMANARFFDLELKRVLAQARPVGQGLAVIYCDLDYFKPINDEHGHSVGDQVLTAVGKRLQGVTKQGVDIAARIGGDEFAVILLNCAPADVALVCDRIRTSVTAPIMIDGATFQVGISIGHCLAAEGERDASKLIKQADVAMYEDKRLKPLRKTTSGTEAHGGFAMTTG